MQQDVKMLLDDVQEAEDEADKEIQAVKEYDLKVEEERKKMIEKGDWKGLRVD